MKKFQFIQIKRNIKFVKIQSIEYLFNFNDALHSIAIKKFIK